MITDNEYKVLNAIATNCFTPVNYGVPETFEETGHVWSDAINDAAEPSDIEGAALSGVCASLAKKKLVDSNGESIGMTRQGFEIWQAARQERS